MRQAVRRLLQRRAAHCGGVSELQLLRKELRDEVQEAELDSLGEDFVLCVSADSGGVLDIRSDIEHHANHGAVVLDRLTSREGGAEDVGVHQLRKHCVPGPHEEEAHKGKAHARLALLEHLRHQIAKVLDGKEVVDFRHNRRREAGGVLEGRVAGLAGNEARSSVALADRVLHNVDNRFNVAVLDDLREDFHIGAVLREDNHYDLADEINRTLRLGDRLSAGDGEGREGRSRGIVAAILLFIFLGFLSLLPPQSLLFLPRGGDGDHLRALCEEVADVKNEFSILANVGADALPIVNKRASNGGEVGAADRPRRGERYGVAAGLVEEGGARAGGTALCAGSSAIETLLAALGSEA